MTNNNDGNNVPIWEKYALSVKEASKYFNIGENKLRCMIDKNKDADWLFWNNTKAMIKRSKFEKALDCINCI